MSASRTSNLSILKTLNKQVAPSRTMVAPHVPDARFSNSHQETFLPREFPDDPALTATPETPVGRPPGWLFAIRSDKKRGTGFKAPSRLPIDVRQVVTTFHVADGECFQKRLEWSIKDFARGTDKNQPGFIQGMPFFTERSENVPARVVKRACIDDGSVYRLMVNPYDGEQVMDKAFVRAIMARAERAVGSRLLWIASVHSKQTAAHASHKHAHILIRSRTIGDEVIRFTRPFSLYGFKWIASQLATEILGPRTVAEIAKAEKLSKELERNRTEQELTAAGVPRWAIDHVLRAMT